MPRLLGTMLFAATLLPAVALAQRGSGSVPLGEFNVMRFTPAAGPRNYFRPRAPRRPVTSRARSA